MKSCYRYSFGKHSILQTPTLWPTHQNYNYMITRDDRAWIVDPGELEPIQRTLQNNKLRPQGIYLTHHHQDHVAAATALAKDHGCPVFGFRKDAHRLPPLDQTYMENEELEIAGLKTQVLLLPGHTLGLCAFYIKEKNWLFSNDLVFSLGCGRVFEGSFKQMHTSLKKLRDLPSETWLFCSHEYTQNNLEFALSLFPEDRKIQQCQEGILEKVRDGDPTVPTLLGFEKTHNPFLRWDDSDLRQQLALGKTGGPQALNPEIMEDWKVFAEIRKRKDQF